MTDNTIPEWFALREGRRNFQIDPVKDHEFLFGEPIWQDQIDSRLKRSQLLGTPVRLVWWGQYGIGKTHRLHHTQYLVEHTPYKYYPCYAVASDVQEKTGFERLHYELVSALGREEMREFVFAYNLKLANQQSGIASLKEISRNNSDVQTALRRFANKEDEGVSLPAWRFLCGMKLRREEVTLAGVTKEGLDSSHDFAAVLGALASIIQAETGKELLFLIDEAENLTRVTNKTAEARWNESIRAMLDIRNVGIVLTVGSERQQDLPKLILQPDIVRRIERDNYVQMAAYKPPEAKNFLKGLLSAWIDPDRRSAIEDSEKLAESAPGYAPELYPFTPGGFEKFCEWAVVDPRTAKPSEIIAKLNNVAAEACLKGRRLITKDHLTEMGIA